MTLHEAINEYIAWRKDHGAKFKSSASVLRLFYKSFDCNIDCDAVTNAQICNFLADKGPLTRYRQNKYVALTGFYRYAISRGYATCSPLPDDEPRPPQSAPPYIFTQDELGRVFAAVDSNQRRAFQLDALTFRTLLLLLYGTGLRQGEAIRLKLTDVDLSHAVLAIHRTKFNKSRLVPVGPQLNEVLTTYAARRTGRPLPKGKASSFLAYRDGTPLASSTIQQAFIRLLRRAGIQGTEGTRQSPGLHSLRHSFAVHRLTAWYRQGADVQRLLPLLSTYLGHADLSGTQVYLSMTPELLQQASQRLERYTRGGDND